MFYDLLIRLGIVAAIISANIRIVSGSEPHVVCYYGSWAVYRPGDGMFDVDDIDPFVCTHVIYAFAGLDPVTHMIYSLDPWNDLDDNWGKGAYKRFNALRQVNPALKTILAIGGWNEGSEKYSRMAANVDSRRIFVSSVVEFLKKYSFVGFDLDWEYPAQRGGAPEDKENFVSLLKELKVALSPYGYTLSAAVSAGKDTMDAAYDVPRVAQYLDYIHVMAYDYHGSWEKFVGINAPLYSRPTDTPENQLLSVNFSINYWLSQGAPAEKLILGMATYGRSFTLTNANQHDVYDPSTGPGVEGPYTREAGALGYNELCQDLNRDGWTTVVDPYYETPYCYKYNQWVSYDDEDSIRLKSNYAKSMGLNGGMIWSLETDDFHGYCGRGKYPLLRVINEVFRGAGSITTTKSTEAPSTTKSTTTTTTTGKPDTTTATTKLTTSTQVTKSPDTTPFDINDYVIANCDLRYVRDPNDCSKYYECIQSGTDYQIYEFQCATGLVFNTVTNTCDWPQNVTC